MQEGTLGLLRACDRFDFTAPGNFTAYASTTIRYAILNALPVENTIRLTHDLCWRNRTDERVEALRLLQPLSLDALRGEEDCAFVDLLAAPPLAARGQSGHRRSRRVPANATRHRMHTREIAENGKRKEAVRLSQTVG